MSNQCWQILGIEPTNDIEAIKQAYRDKLPEFHPEIDPEGFKALRQAFEQAKQYHQQPSSVISVLQGSVTLQNLNLHSTDSQMAENVDQPVTITSPIELELLSEFEQLVDDPQRCYQPEAWQSYIDLIDQQSFEVINQIRWPLFHLVYEKSGLSKQCEHLLLNRLGWGQRTTEIPSDDVLKVEHYLDYLAQADYFDLSTLTGCHRDAQKATHSYLSMLNYLQRNRSLYVAREYLLLPTVIYLPDHQPLFEQLAVDFSLASVGCEQLCEIAEQKLEADQNDIDWLFICARQHSLLSHNNQAISYWVRLLETSKRADAIQWLLSWCRYEQPDYLPLLIQAFDEPEASPEQPYDIDDERQNDCLPKLNVVTLVRFGEALQYDLPELALTYLQWQFIQPDQHEKLVTLLIDDNHDNQDDNQQFLLKCLYRHATMLKLGNQTLLQAILDEPIPEDGLVAFILRQLQQQAQQQLECLQQSKIINVFTEWLYDLNVTELPELLVQRKDTYIEAHLNNWFIRLQWLPNYALSKLRLVDQFGWRELQLYRTLSFLAYKGVMLLPEPQSQQVDDVWQWYRATYAFHVLLENPAIIIELVKRDRSLCLQPDHPLNVLREKIYPVDLSTTYWSWQVALKLDWENTIDYQIVVNLPFSIKDYVNYLPDQYLSLTYHRWCDVWQDTLNSASSVDQLLLNAIYAHQQVWDSGVDLSQQLQNMSFETEGLQLLCRTLIRTETYPFSKSNDPLQLSDCQIRLVNMIGQLAKGKVLRADQERILLSDRDNQQERVNSRLYAGLLLDWNHSLHNRTPKKQFNWFYLLLFLFIFFVLPKLFH